MLKLIYYLNNFLISGMKIAVLLFGIKFFIMKIFHLNKQLIMVLVTFMGHMTYLLYLQLVPPHQIPPQGAHDPVMLHHTLCIHAQQSAPSPSIAATPTHQNEALIFSLADHQQNDLIRFLVACNIE